MGRPRRGQALLGVVISLTFLFAVMGLSIDLGWAYYLKTRVQTAADAAATAAAVYAMNNNDSCTGAGAVSCGVPYTCAGAAATNSLTAGCLYATSDGPPSVTAVLIENNTASPGSSGINPSMWIQATVSTTAPNFFLFGSGYRSASISASAIAGVAANGDSSGCVYALGTSGTVFTATGSGNVTTNCGIYANANFVASGSGNLNAPGSKYAGTYSDTGSGAVISPPTHMTSTLNDPFSSIPAPSFPNTCDHTNFSVSSSSPSTINPGIFCNGLAISGSGAVTLNSGIYYINGGSLSISASGGTSGTGVTFVIDGKYGRTASAINFSGSGNITITAPTSGTYRGLLIYQNPAITYAGTNTISGSGAAAATGTYYFPTTALSYSGSGSGTYQAIVAKSVTFSGSGNFLKDVTGNKTGFVKNSAALLQ